jgi:hypothetical protein
MPCVSPVDSIQFDALRSQRDNGFIRATAKMGYDKIRAKHGQTRAKNGKT